MKNFSTHSLIFFLGSVTVLFFLWRYQARWAAVPFTTILLFFYFYLPRLAKRRLKIFNRKALKLITSNKPEQVVKLAKKQLLLQYTGFTSTIDAMLGLACVQMEEYDKASPLLESGMASAFGGKKITLKAALAKSLFFSGYPDKAKIHATSIIKAGIKLPEVMVIKARTQLYSDRITDETFRLLSEAKKLSPDKDIKLMIELTSLEINLMVNKNFNAELPANVDSNKRSMRTWIHLVRGKIREKKNDTKGALVSYEKALKDTSSGFILECAYDAIKRLEKLK